MLPILIKSVIFATVFIGGSRCQLKTLQENHRAQQLTNSNVIHLARLSNEKYTNQVLDNILIPRVVGTPNHEKVFNYIKRELQRLNWHIEVDEFQDKAPKFGTLTFRNIIATLNPDASRFLVLACHYDSKYFENDIFVGAIDSAVPCAMLLNLAKVMQNELSQSKNNLDLSLKLIFFDGEEAFVNWGPKDSIYGAKHLANKYHSSLQSLRNSEEIVTELQKIDLLVLLDLIGHKETAFYSFFPNTERWYLRMARAEEKLRELGLLRGSQRYFTRKRQPSHIEDDHIPFLKRDVPVLHLISVPFPPEWHTPYDNRDILDADTIGDINKILRIFVAEYLHISVAEMDIPDKEL